MKVISIACALATITTHAQSWQSLASFGGPTNDFGIDHVVDANGNSYLTGYISGTVIFGADTMVSYGDADIYLAKYDSSGNPVWAINMGGSDFDRGDALAIDDDNNVYLTGFFQDTAMFGQQQLIGNGIFADVFLTKVDPAGDIRWTKQFGGSSSDVCYGMTFGPDKNLYLTGHIRDTFPWDGFTLMSTGLQDVSLIKIDTSGTTLGAMNFGGSGQDRGYDIKVASNGDIYVTGYFDSTVILGSDTLVSQHSFDVFTAKFSASMIPEWAQAAGGQFQQQPAFCDIDGAGNVYVSGYFFGDSIRIGNIRLDNSNPGRPDGFLVKYSTTGDLQWAKHLGGPSWEYMHEVDAVESSLFVTAEFNAGGSWDGQPLSNIDSTDILVMRLDDNGDVVWSEVHGGPATDVGWNVQYTDGYLYLSGHFADSCAVGSSEIESNGDFDVYLTRKAQSVLAGFEPLDLPPARIWPNPAARTVAIQSVEGQVVEIYNGRGALMRTVRPSTAWGLIDVSNWPTGVYYVRAGVQAAKLIVAR